MWRTGRQRGRSRRTTASDSCAARSTGSPPRPGSATPLEVIVVSDGSTDGTDEYLASAAVPAARSSACARPNAGPAAARNRGVDAARRASSSLFIDDDVVPARTSSPPTSAATTRRDDDLVVIGPMLTPDDHDALAVGPVGAGHAVQAVRRDAARRLGGDGPAVLHRQRLDRPPPPRSTPAASTRRSGGPRTSSSPTGWPTAGCASRSTRAPSCVHYAERSFDVVARRGLRLRAQRRHLRPRPRPGVAARRDRPRVPRPPRARPRRSPATLPAAPAAAPRGDRRRCSVVARARRPRLGAGRPAARSSAVYNLAYYRGMADELGGPADCSDVRRGSTPTVLHVERALTPPRVGFVLEQTLGHITHAANLRAPRRRRAPTIDAVFAPIEFDVDGLAGPRPRATATGRSAPGCGPAGRSAGCAATARSTRCSSTPRCRRSSCPITLRRIPTVVSLDATPIQYDELGEHYGHDTGGAAASSG